METIRHNIALLIPIILLELGLMGVALKDLIPRPTEQVTGGNKLIWGVVIVVFQMLGPITYLVFGRRQEG